MKQWQPQARLADFLRQLGVASRAIVRELGSLNRAGIALSLMHGRLRRDRAAMVKAALAERYRERGSCC